MRRRGFLAAAASALGSRAAPAATVPRIGVLSFGAPASGAAGAPDPGAGFRRGLREAGLIEGQNVAIEWRHAYGDATRLQAAAHELVRLRVDVLLAGGPAAIDAARKATRTIPIVAVGGGDPVREGWARSLPQPGGNVTGFTVTFPELPAKRLELLREALPVVTRVAVVLAPAEVMNLAQTRNTLHAAAAQLRVTLQFVEVSQGAELAGAVDRALADRSQAALALATNTVVTHRAPFAERALQRRLPTMSDFPQMARAGVMLTYGADLDDLGQRSAALVDKLLKGARPQDMPIEQPQKLSLVINQRTVRSLGLTMPKSILLRADEVIE